jgi:RNA polymerase sigma-70 factor (ECF subfamily)
MAPDRPVATDRGGEADEKTLIEAAQTDPGRFGELYELNFDRVYAYIARRVRDRAEAQDLTSEVFHQALANLRRFEWRGAPFAAWLYRIAANAIADRARRLERERGIPESDTERAVDPAEETDPLSRIFALVRDLPADQRRVVEMRFVDQKSIREIAQELGRSEGAIKQLQFRGLETLRARTGESHG